jgi:cell wall-associated NlpC family hydrolase
MTPDLQPGDILLYNSGDWVDRLICFRTWSDVAHVEVYLGDGKSAASRNGEGVGVYPVRFEGLRYVRRPQGQFSKEAAQAFASAMDGTPYGFLDLLKFYSLNVPCKGLICSQFADLLLRNAGVVAFSEDYDAGAVSPRDFRITACAKTVWSEADLASRKDAEAQR